MTQKLIILTAEPTNFVPVRLKEEADALGVEARILNIENCLLSEGVDLTTCSRICEYMPGKDDKPGYFEHIDIDENTYIIPRLNEYHLEIKLGIIKRMQDYGAQLLNSVESMALCNNKLMSQILINTANINTPFSFIFQNVDLVEPAIAQMEEAGKLKYPIIVKTLRGTHGIGVMKIDSRSSLVSVAQTLMKSDIEFMCQEFIEHQQSARIIMIGTEVLAANMRGQAKEKDEFRTNSHLGSKTDAYDPPKDEIELCRKLVEIFGCNFCAIDYIVVESFGKKKIIVLEVNGSPGLEAISKDWPNKNLPKDVIEYCIRNAFDGECPPCPDGIPAVTDISIDDVPVIAPATVAPATPAPEVSVTSDEIDVTYNPITKEDGTLLDVEHVILHRIINPNAQVPARIDTGAKTSSFHADEIDFDELSVTFVRDDVKYRMPVKRVVKIKDIHSGENTERPVVVLDITIMGKQVNGMEFTITDRSNMKYEVLIGRNIIAALGYSVSVRQDAPESHPTPEVEVTTNEEE